MDYNHREIEKKWQAYWAENEIYKTQNKSDKPKYYVLDMFPYPSGAGLHVGHPLGYIASDIYARYQRLQGFNVLHPQGYDAFGLPAEQYAINTGQAPEITTKANIATYRKQLDRLGFSFDWSREVRTCDADYYRWTQWIFVELFESWYDKTADKARPIKALIAIFEKEGNQNTSACCDEDTPTFTHEQWLAFDGQKKQQILLQYRLAYRSDAVVNWCPELGTVLANDEVIGGYSERGGHPVVQRKMTQWSLRITAYAHRLLADLSIIDWPKPIKEAQQHWIGRSQGADVSFKVEGHQDVNITVFTTRPDTIFGVSFMVLAPEHLLVAELTTPQQQEAVAAYVKRAAQKTELDRLTQVKTVSGAFTGAYVLHPFTKERVPIWISDYVLARYGTGAVMGVPSGDSRDHRFAKHFDLPIKAIFKGVDLSEDAYEAKDAVMDNSDFITGLCVADAIEKVIAKLKSEGIGKDVITYRLRDAVFSRQRYWGEPFPIYYKEGMPQVIDAQYLPIKLPKVANYLPTKEGNPPLGNASHWAWCTETHQVVSNDKIDQKTVFPLELNTMPGWAGSSWYFNRYMDSKNQDTFANEEALNYWREVDLYVGGSEHATGHLLYARFWQKLLYDRGFVLVSEFAKKLINQGMILGTSAFIYKDLEKGTYISKNKANINAANVQKIHVDIALLKGAEVLDVDAFKQATHDAADADFILEDDGRCLVAREVEKMSKSKYNVVNPDFICDEYGADTLRLFEMFLGPIEQDKPWNTSGISGVVNFFKKFWRLYHSSGAFYVAETTPTEEALKILHKTIDKIKTDTESFSFNTAVSTFMIATNQLTKIKACQRAILEPLVVLIAPYAPHIAEELWQKLGHQNSVSFATFPKAEAKYLKEDTKKYPISFNGKMRFTLTLPLSMSKDGITVAVMNHENTQKYLGGKTPKKIIVVPNKIVNIVF